MAETGNNSGAAAALTAFRAQLEQRLEECERLLAGSLQIGFVRLPVPVGLEHLRLRRDRLTLAVSAIAQRLLPEKAGAGSPSG